MKLLLLSLCGEDNADENLQNINLYLASLTRHVIPYYQTKVLLFSTFNATEKTKRRINEFGLREIIEVHTYDSLPIPTDTRQWLKSWNYFAKIGIHMNMLFDYAKTQNFFDADWVFHTDTDLRFLENFQANLNAINALIPVNPRLLISCAGDANPISVRYKNKRYEFMSPPRWKVLEDPVPSAFSLHSLHPTERPYQSPDDDVHRIVFQHKCLKVRNDFVGLSNQTAREYDLNWVHTGYAQNFSHDHANENTTVATKEVEALWNTHSEHTTLPLFININEDKGSLILDWLKTGTHGVTWIQLRGWQDMVHHYGSGWAESHVKKFAEYSRDILEHEYTDTAHIWRGDYN